MSICLMIILSTLMMTLKHPISMGMTLMIQTINVCVMTGKMSLNYWFSYVMFLIMIGGMLILFMYMTSVASNEKFKYSLKMTMLMMIMFTMMMITKTITDPFLMTNMEITKEMINSQENFKMSLNKFINFPMYMTLLMTIMYLLITLIAVVKITNFKEGPLRQMN